MNKKTILIALMSLLFYGCGQDKVQTYELPKQVKSKPNTVEMIEESVKIGFKADPPKNWQVIPGKGMRVISYSIDETDIDFYAIKLGMGDLVSNVNRWRGQIGLQDQTPEEIALEVKPLMANGAPVSFVELYNPELNKGILAAIVDTKPTYWYFTAKGNIEELKANSSDIQRFINSIRFD